MTVTAPTPVRTSADSFSVPVVDLANDPPEALADALVTASCAFVVNHGVDPQLRRAMVRVSKAFMDRPRERKEPFRWDGTGLWRGWQPVYEGSPELTGQRLPDLVQRFEIQLQGRRTDDPVDLAALAESFALWPDDPAFAAAWTRYYSACGQLAGRLFADIAARLDLPAEDLPAWTDEHFANLISNDYLAQETPPAPGQVRTRPHTDRGGLTLLWADDAPGGLEVLLTNGTDWIPVQIPEDAFLVQAGDLLGRWTNRRIRPNVHQVVNPPAGLGAASRRMAIVYFHYPRLDAVVAPAPSCIDPAARRTPPPPVTARDHIFRRQEQFKTYDADGVDELLAEAAAG